MRQYKKLKAYNYIINKIYKTHKGDKVYIKLLEYSKSTVEEYIASLERALDEASLQSQVSASDLGKWIGTSADVMIRGSPGFIAVMKSPLSYGYKYLVYLLKCKLTKYLDLPYIGFTSDLGRRLKDHIYDALTSYHKGTLNRPVQQAIVLALEIELPAILHEISRIDPSISSLQDLSQNLNEFYFWLQSCGGPFTRFSKQLYNFIIEKVIKKYFDIIEVSYHKSRDGCLSRERDLTLHFRHKLADQVVKGTIWPNGLNLRPGGSGGKLQSYLPILDYLGLASLGIKHRKICQILNKVYGQNFKENTIYKAIVREFGSFDKLLDIVLKPVVEQLIKDTERFELKRDLARALEISDVTLSKKLQEWFNNKFSDLRALVDASFLDWSKINEYNADVQRVLRGFSKDMWVN